MMRTFAPQDIINLLDKSHPIETHSWWAIDEAVSIYHYPDFATTIARDAHSDLVHVCYSPDHTPQEIIKAIEEEWRTGK